MDYFSYKNCVGLNTINDTVFWGNNSTKLIEVQPIMGPPILRYQEEVIQTGNSSILYYEWCGPLMLMLKLFAIHMNAKIYPHTRDAGDYYEGRLPKVKYNEGPHLILVPYGHVSSLKHLKEQTGTQISRLIGLVERPAIISKTVKNEWPLSSLFACFDNNVYYSILICLALSAFLFCLRNRKLQTFLSVAFTFVFALLSDPFARRTTATFARTIVRILLLVSVVLLPTFSGKVYDLLMRKESTDKTDSWDHLYTKPNCNKLRIYSSQYSQMFESNQYCSSPMAQQLAFDPLTAAFDIGLPKRIIRNSTKGNATVTLDSLAAYHFKTESNLNQSPKFREEHDHHISKFGSRVKPYFVVFLSRANNELKQRFNYFMTRLDQNGIYEREVRRSLKPRVHGPDINAKVDTNPHGFGPLTMTQMKAVFTFFMVCTSFNIFVFLMELFAYYYLNKILDFVARVYITMM